MMTSEAASIASPDAMSLEVGLGGISPAASPEETAAIAAAIQRFLSDHAVPHVGAAPEMNPWFRAGLLEGTGHSLDGSFSAGPSFTAP